MTGPLAGALYTETIIVNDSARAESRGNTKTEKGTRDSSPVKVQVSEKTKEQLSSDTENTTTEKPTSDRTPVDYSKQLKQNEQTNSAPSEELVQQEKLAEQENPSTPPELEEQAEQENPGTPAESEKQAGQEPPAELAEQEHPELKEPYRDPTDTLTVEEKKKVEELEKLDQEIKTHERLHATVGGAYTRGAPTFKMTVGPDGRQYAIAGHVDIDVSKGRTPEETIRKAQIIKSAATAPASPSTADMMIALQAGQMEMEARAEISQRMLKQSRQNDQVTDDTPMHEKNQSDKFLSLLAVSPPTLDQVLKSMRSKDE